MIEATGIRKFYGARAALDDVTFTIAKGEIAGFLGLNGAGKTTMLRILCGLLLPSAGRVCVDGIDAVVEPLALRRLIGFLPDRPPLYPEMSVREMLCYAGRLNGLASGRLASRVDDVIGMTGLAGVADDLIETLSHGYRQRVGIATAIVHEPRVVVLDEPISGLDPAQIVEMRALIRGLKDKHTVLMSSHILGEVSETCDRVLVLHGGRIVAQGSEALLRGNGGNKRVEIVARGALAQLQKSEVLTVDGVRDAEAIEQEGGLVRVRARFASDEAREQLIRSLVERGFGVRTVVELESDLEALFLKLTGASSSPGAPNTAPSTSQKEAA